MKIVKNKEYREFVAKLEKRIVKGIRFLDKNQKREDWEEKINILKLNLESSEVCIIGQVFGAYANGFGSNGEFGKFMDGVKYGFNLSEKEQDRFPYGFDLLTYLWAKKLTELKFKNGFN